MRLISQDGKADVPYETSILMIMKAGKTDHRIYAMTSERNILMGAYTSLDAALYEMNRVRTSAISGCKVFYFTQVTDDEYDPTITETRR